MRKTGLTPYEAVLAVARLRSFRAAADELGLSTTALSNAVASLEQELGTRLFRRTTRSVSLTEAGEAFTEQLAPALAGMQRARDLARGRPGRPAGRLRINTSLGAARMALDSVLAEYLRRYPDVTLDLVTEGRLVDIVAEGFDAGLRPGTLVPLDMVRVEFGGPLRVAVVGAPALLAEPLGEPVDTPAELMRRSCIRARLPGGAPAPWAFAQQGQVLELDVPGQLIVDSPALMRDAALMGLGLAQLPEWYVRGDLATGRLVSVLQDWVTPLPPLALYYPAGRQQPAALRALVALIHELSAAPSGAAQPPAPGSDL